MPERLSYGNADSAAAKKASYYLLLSKLRLTGGDIKAVQALLAQSLGTIAMPAGTQWYRPPSGSVLSAAPGSARTRGLSLLFPQGTKTSGISPRLPTIWLRPTTLYPCKKAMPDGIAPRKPATALMSVLTVALSSVAVKQTHYNLPGQRAQLQSV